MTLTEVELDEGYRDAVDATVHDIDERNHQVIVEFPHEVIDGHRSDWGQHCFKESFERQLPVMLYNHDENHLIGRAVGAESLGPVSRIVGKFSNFGDVPKAREAFANIRDGILPGWSFHFRGGRSVPHPNVRSARRFVKADMLEFSPVLYPSIPGTTTVGLRSAERNGSIQIAKVDAALAHAQRVLEGRRGLPTEVLQRCIEAGYRADIRRGGLRDDLRRSLDRAGLL